MKIRNTFIIFIISGFWHGANWTFIAWGALNAIFFLPLLLTQRNSVNLDTVAQGKIIPTMREAFAMLVTFSLTLLAWIFFRAENINHALQYLSSMLSPSMFHLPVFGEEINALKTIILVAFLLIVEWFGRNDQFAIARLLDNWSQPLRYIFYYTLVIALFWFGAKEQDFIYFQF